MYSTTMRGAAAVLAVAALLALPADCSACSFLCNLFGGCSHCGGGAPTYAPAAAYAPAYVSPGCATCPTSGCATCPTTANYLPQTCYRTVYSAAPVTAYRPCTSCDPCSGCPVTTYRPVTTWVQQASLIPYTSYRLVYTSAVVPAVTYYTPASTSCASGCSTGSCYAPSSGCSSCSSYSTPASGCSSCATSSPGPVNYSSEPPATNAAPTKTFQEPAPMKTERPAIEPIPDSRAGTTSLPKADTSGRVTQYPVRHANFELISTALRPSPVQNVARPVSADDSGWRASSN